MGLTPGELFERSACQPAGDGGADLLHLVEVHIKVRSVSAAGSVGDNLPPLLGQLFQRRQLLR